MGFSNKIKEIRRILRLNQTEFAEKLGVSRSIVSEFENDAREPSKEFIIALSKLGVSVDWFLTGDGEVFLNISKEEKQANKLANRWESDSHQEANKLANRWESDSHQEVKNLTNDWEAIPIGKQETLPIKKTISNSIEALAMASTAPQFAELEEKMDGKFSAQEEKLNGLQKRLEDLESAFSSGAKPKETPLPRAEEVKEVAPPYGADCEADQEETVELPLAENLAAGMPREAFSTGETFSVPVSFLKKRKKYCVAKIKGTSMTEAGIADGAFVLLEVNETPVCGAIALVRYGNQTTLKRLHQKDDGTWELWYEDGSGAVIPLKDGEWEVIGHYVRVVGRESTKGDKQL
ncbi:MAG: S24 family peptidase [Treponemataceae bacterium]